MNSTSTLDIAQIFEENGYQIKELNDVISLSKTRAESIVSFLIFGSIGTLLLTFGLYFGLHFTTIILGIVSIGAPLIYERWRYPNRILIDSRSRTVTLKSGLTISKVYSFQDIQSLEVDESVVTSDVSPFKEGYQDFIYSFQLGVGAGKQRLVNLVFRQSSDSVIGYVTDFLSGKLSLNRK